MALCGVNINPRFHLRNRQKKALINIINENTEGYDGCDGCDVLSNDFSMH
uniref:Uncharacterized protein n=1 Tax=Rhizophagus irregularis (strain DAOM 181602 / DAOM 197198 / MUCL 43194) TaxID=747089 RepID=U9UL16_RHIID